MKQASKEEILSKYQVTFDELAAEKPLSPIAGMGMVSIKQAVEHLGTSMKEVQTLRQKLKKDMDVLGMKILTTREVAPLVPSAVRHPDGSYDLPLEDGSTTTVPCGKYTYFTAPALKRLVVELGGGAAQAESKEATTAIAPIAVYGRQQFMDGDIPVVLGGFGPGAKCICDKTIAEIHGMNTFDVRRRITDNIKRFRFGVEYIDVLGAMRLAQTSELLAALGYSRQEALQAKSVYILSERGYSKLIKIMDTDKAWEIYDHMLDEYFLLREERRRDGKVREIPKDFASCMRMLADEVDYSKALEEKVDAMSYTNAMLAQHELAGSPREIVVQLIRKYAAVVFGCDFRLGWSDFYKELRYRKGIGLTQRIGGKSVLDRVRDDEWTQLISVASALCLESGIDPAKVVKQVNAELYGIPSVAATVALTGEVIPC